MRLRFQFVLEILSHNWTQEVETIMTTPEAKSVQRSRTVYHPVVSSMVEQNTLKTCLEVKELFESCQSLLQAGADEPFICRTAKKYHETCISQKH